MKPTLLAEEALKKQLAALKGWTREGKLIRKTVKLSDFVHAMGFVNSVALLAEKMNHHPDIDIRWNTVTLVLSTHSAGGLTELDMKLAAEINAL
jgi:4a-hydroxytetrahydrobiopterin dehydratase